MKNFLTILFSLLLLSSSACAQGLSIRSLNGFGTNTTFWVYDGSFVPQMVGTTFGSSFLWATKNSDFLLAITPSKFIVYSNTEFRGYISYSTNAGSTATITLGRVQSLSTNNNLSFTGLANKDGTYYQTALLSVTNTTAAAKTATFASSFNNMTDGLNPIYFTNFLQVFVSYDPSAGGTNFYYKSR